jgi:DNA-binding phage protein
MDADDDPACIVHALGVIGRAKNMSWLARDAGLADYSDDASKRCV